jgi:hypothetical protein
MYRDVSSGLVRMLVMNCAIAFLIRSDLYHLILIANGGHVFLEGQRHPQASLVRVFGYRQFFSSFWILEITRFTVSSIRSSLGLYVRGLFVRAHKGLMSRPN